MFRLEKVFQNDDSAFILFVNCIKSFSIFITIYLFSIFEKNSIYEILNFHIYSNSEYFVFSIWLPLIFFFILNKIKNSNHYQKNFLSFLRNDIVSFFLAYIVLFAFFYVTKHNSFLNYSYVYLTVILIIMLLLSKYYFNFLYNNLISKNIIQKNVMLVGSYKEILQIINNKIDDIFVFKCCLMTDFENQNKKLIKSEIKFPIFNNEDDIRSILEYHFLGQIWVLNGDEKKKSKIFKKIIRYSVDTFNINLNKKINLKGQKLFLNKYTYEIYEISKFYGINLLIKILIDKFLSLIFIIFSLPILLISSLAILIEDGFPILFTQNRTGWDGRRFKIYKLRTLKNAKYDPIKQVTKDDKRKLISGKILRRYSIDEIPQLFNVLIGDMSLVGPRPHPVSLDLNYSNIYEAFLTRYRCNPGLTGWSQVNGLRGATPNPEIMKRRMEFDLWYLNNWTIWLDLYIILKTFYAVIKYEGD